MPEELIPIFRVKDGYKAADWYARLGFVVEGEHRFAPGLPLYLFLRRGPMSLHLSEHEGDARPHTLVYMWVHDLDEIAAEFGVKVVKQPWAREVQLTDPDGNRLRIGEVEVLRIKIALYVFLSIVKRKAVPHAHRTVDQTTGKNTSRNSPTA